MKNRILWIFEDGQEPQNIENEATQTETEVKSEAFVSLPWALFGRLAEPERQKMQDIYQAAYERAQNGLEERNEEIERFERLLEGVSAHELTEDY